MSDVLICCDSLPANVIEARKRLLQPYDEEVTIWQTFTARAAARGGSKSLTNGIAPAVAGPIRLLCETFFCNKTRSPSAGYPRQTIVAVAVDRGILAIS